VKGLSALQAADRLRRMGRNLKDGLKRAEQANVADALRIARLYSRGQLTGADLQRMGHPYRRGVTPPTDPAVINRRSGLFLRSWRAEGPTSTATAFTSRLRNDAPHAAFLLRGTRKMIRRPLLDRVAAFLRARRERRLNAAIDRSLRF
jgi:hypothetical protein